MSGSTYTVPLPPSGSYNFTTITIGSGVTVQFAPNATNTAATLLATGDVTIAGTLDLSGKTGGNGATGTATAPNGGLPGPGGGAGGSGSTGILSGTGGTGLGPGGGCRGAPAGAGSNPQCSGAGAGHNGAGGNGTGGYTGTCLATGGGSYGGARLLPLLGGSGGGGGSAYFTTSAAGGGGGGGALRLMAPLLTGSGGSLLVAGGTAGTGGCVPGQWGSLICAGAAGAGAPGRLRLEASTFGLTATMTVVASQGPLGTVTLANPPSLPFSSVAGLSAPASPQGSYGSPDLTLPPGFTNPVPITLEGSQIPLGTVVTVRSAPLQGITSSATGPLTGTEAASSVSVALSLPATQPTVLTAEATFALLAGLGTGPLYAEGEEVQWVRVCATLGGQATVTYLTVSGKEVPAAAIASLAQ